MKLEQVVFALLTVVLIVGVILVYSSQGNLALTTRTIRFTTTTTLITTVIGTATTTVYENAIVVGNCTSVYHVIPDTIVESIIRSTVTSGAFTSVTTYTTGITATEETGPTSTYATSSYANYTSVFVVTSTAHDLGAIPSNAWVVSVCTYRR